MGYIEFSKPYQVEKITPVQHTFHNHPLFTLDSLREAAKSLPKHLIRFHANTARADSSFEQVEKHHPSKHSFEDAISNLENSGSWIALHHLQEIPEYAEVLKEALDQISSTTNALDPGLHWRVLWVFIQSPYSLTPFHMDHENNFLMQVSGKKTAYLWNRYDCLTDQDHEHFHGTSSRNQIKFLEEYRKKATIVNLSPGNGAYMPAGSPHLVENGDNVAITISMTYLTERTRKRETFYRCNHALRKLGMNPAPYPSNKATKFHLFNGYLNTRKMLTGKSKLPTWMTDVNGGI